MKSYDFYKHIVSTINIKDIEVCTMCYLSTNKKKEKINHIRVYMSSAKAKGYTFKHVHPI